MVLCYFFDGIIFMPFKRTFHLCLLGCVVLTFNSSAAVYDPKGSYFQKTKPSPLSSF